MLPSIGPVTAYRSRNNPVGYPVSANRVVRSVGFGAESQATPQFIAPMVVEGAPPFDANNPVVVRYYMDLMETAKTFSIPEVSGRRIGVVAVGQSGRVYLGTNVEIKGSAPSDTIHGEAFALTLARAYGEKGIERLILSLQPCGPCRQIVREAGNEQMPLHFIDSNAGMTTATIGQLFPYGYSYATPQMNMYQQPLLNLPTPNRNRPMGRLDRQAFQSAGQSYLPNPRQSWSGIGVQLKNGKQYTGNAITVSGPNPTITPIQNVIVKMVSEKQALGDIHQARLVEPDNPDYSFFANTKAILALVAPGSHLKKISLPPANRN